MDKQTRNEVAQFWMAEITELRARLAALDWIPISPENPVQTGDEVLTRERSSVFVPEAGHLKGCPTEEWLALGYTHRRPLNPPAGGNDGKS